MPDWERSASARLLISSAIILSRSDVGAGRSAQRECCCGPSGPWVRV